MARGWAERPSEQWQGGKRLEGLLDDRARRRGKKKNQMLNVGGLASAQVCWASSRSSDCLWPRVYQSSPVSPAVDTVFREGPSVIPQKGFNSSQAPLYVFSYHPLSSPVKWAGPREVKLLFQSHTAGQQCLPQLSSIPHAVVCAPCK